MQKQRTKSAQFQTFQGLKIALQGRSKQPNEIENIWNLNFQGGHNHKA
jgi:hypothetical protein